MINGGIFSGNIAAADGGAIRSNSRVSVQGATFTGNQANGSTADNGGGAIFINGSNCSAVVTDSIFTGNSAGSADDGAADSLASGGAIHALNNCPLTITNSLFRQNSAQGTGAVFEIDTPGSDSTLTNVTALNNSAGAGGGVLHSTFLSEIRVVGGLFANNSATVGGAFSVLESTLNIDGATISGNEATGDDATQGGGGIYLADRTEDTFATLVVANTRIVGNTTSGTSGSGGGVFVGAGDSAEISFSRIAANTANRAGGGIENAGGSVALDSVTLGGIDAASGNDAGSNPGNGGGLHSSGADFVEIFHSTVGNNAAVNGGGVWTSDGSDTFFIDTSTISNNTAARGAGVYLNGDGSEASLFFASITNNNGAGIEFGDSGSGSVVVFAPSLVANNSGSDVGSNVDVTHEGDLDSSALVTGTVPVGAYRLFGGTTATQPLTSESTAALNTNDSCGDEFSSTDQRGASRPSNVGAGSDSTSTGDCDAGAFELTDDPVIVVANNSQASATLTNRTDEVSVVAFTLPNSSDTAITIAGFTGSINRGGAMDEDGEPTLPADINLADAQLTVYTDDNQNGQFDSGELEVGQGQFDANGTTYTVTFTPSVSIPANDSMSYVMTFQLSSGPMTMSMNALAPVFAGGGLLGIIGLLSLGGLSRRTRVVLIVISLSLMLTACPNDNDNVNVGGVAGGSSSAGGGGGDNDGDGGDGNGNGDGGSAAPLTANQVQFVIESLTSSGTDNLIIGDNLPIIGSTVTFALDDQGDGA